MLVGKQLLWFILMLTIRTCCKRLCLWKRQLLWFKRKPKLSFRLRCSGIWEKKEWNSRSLSLQVPLVKCCSSRILQAMILSFNQDSKVKDVKITKATSYILLVHCFTLQLGTTCWLQTHDDHWKLCFLLHWILFLNQMYHRKQLKKH